MKTLDPATLPLDNLDRVEEYLNQLLAHDISDPESLEAWLVQRGRLTEALAERISRNTIDFACNTEDEDAKARHEFDQQKLMPLMQRCRIKLDRRFYDSPYRSGLPGHYGELAKRTAAAIEIHRDENIPIEVETRKLVNDYFALSAKMTVHWQGEEKTLQQMDQHLRSSDREEREQAWKLIQSRRLRDKDTMDEIMNKLVSLRHQIANNAGLPNYRDYSFKRLCRFSYSPEDCHRFRDAVAKHVVPLHSEIMERRRQKLGIDAMKPWDTDGTPKGQNPLKPYKDGNEFVSKCVNVLARVDPQFGQLLQAMNDRGCLDLETRKGKRPGGFCSNLPLSGTSFIFMNAAATHGSVRTLVHESGHAIHNLLTTSMLPFDYRRSPAESAELASMSMELLTMSEWGEFYADPADLKRAQREQLEGIVAFLPWALTVDSFQHWIYLNTSQDASARNHEFAEIARSLAYRCIDWTGFEEELMHRWKAQMHIFAYPFYYIEYAIAQLGALQLHRLYKKDKAAGIAGYKNALSLGSSAPLPEVYAAAGIDLDFSDKTVSGLMAFVSDELASLG
jgi:oligoendopeptidase F